MSFILLVLNPQFREVSIKFLVVQERGVQLLKFVFKLLHFRSFRLSWLRFEIAEGFRSWILRNKFLAEFFNWIYLCKCRFNIVGIVNNVEGHVNAHNFLKVYAVDSCDLIQLQLLLLFWKTSYHLHDLRGCRCCLAV